MYLRTARRVGEVLRGDVEVADCLGAPFLVSAIDGNNPKREKTGAFAPGFGSPGTCTAVRRGFRSLKITSSVSLTFESFARPVTFAPHPPSDEVVDLVIGMLNRLRWHADDRLRGWIHHNRFSVTDFAR